MRCRRAQVNELSRRVTKERRKIAQDSNALRYRERAIKAREELDVLSNVELRRELGGAMPATEEELVELAQRIVALLPTWHKIDTSQNHTRGCSSVLPPTYVVGKYHYHYHVLLLLFY